MVYKRRHLNYFLDRALKLLAVINFMMIASINDFDGWKAVLIILGMIAIELVLIGIISKWGRND